MLLIGVTCWVLGATTAWMFIHGAELRRRRDAVLRGEHDPDLGLLDDLEDDGA